MVKEPSAYFGNWLYKNNDIINFKYESPKVSKRSKLNASFPNLVVNAYKNLYFHKI